MAILTASPSNPIKLPFSSRQRIRDRREIVADPVRPDPPKNEETAIGDNDIALAEQGTVQGRIRGDLVCLGGAWRLPLDMGRVFLNHRRRREHRHHHQDQ
jgi:hypothetical protein